MKHIAIETVTTDNRPRTPRHFLAEFFWGDAADKNAVARWLAEICDGCYWVWARDICHPKFQLLGRIKIAGSTIEGFDECGISLISIENKLNEKLKPKVKVKTIKKSQSDEQKICATCAAIDKAIAGVKCAKWN